MLPCTPTRSHRLGTLHQQSSGSFIHCPIPQIPDFEGLAESETDSDDELLQRARMRASGVASSPKLATPTRPVDVGTDGAGLSPLSSLINRIGAIGRSSPSRHSRSHSPEPENDTEDLAAAAHRAEVRRLTHKIIQEELEKERQPQPSRSYKRSTMTTIKEDPSDASIVLNGEKSDTLAAADGSGPRDSVQYGRTGHNENSEDASTRSRKGKETVTLRASTSTSKNTVPARSFALQNSKVGLPHGLGIRGRTRSGEAKTPKDSSEVVPVADQPPKCRLQPTALSSTGVSTLPSSSGCAASKQARSQDSDSKDLLRLTPPHSREISDSLGSVEDDGSIHEAREAHFVTARQLHTASRHVYSIDYLKEAHAFVHSVPNSAQRAPRREGEQDHKPSDSSQISSLELPPPVVSMSSTSQVERTVTDPVTPEGLIVLPERLSNTLPGRGRRGFSKLQFLSLSRTWKFQEGAVSQIDANKDRPQLRVRAEKKV